MCGMLDESGNVYFSGLFVFGFGLWEWVEWGGRVIYTFPVEDIRLNGDGNSYYYLGNGFEIICRDENGRFMDPVVIFGRYRQSFIGSGEVATNGTNALEGFAIEPLTWVLFDVNRGSGSAVMITEYVHDNVLFNLTTAAGNAYATSNLRAFLNSDGGVCRRSTTAK